MYTHTCGWGWEMQVGHMWVWSAYINCVCSYACCAVYVHAWNMRVHYIVPVYDGEHPSANGIWETGGDGETPSTNGLCEAGPGWHMTLVIQRKLPPAQLFPLFFKLHPLRLDPPCLFCEFSAAPTSIIFFFSLYLDLGLLWESNECHSLTPTAEFTFCRSSWILVHCLCHMNSLQEGNYMAVSSGLGTCVKYKLTFALPRIIRTVRNN